MSKTEGIDHQEEIARHVNEKLRYISGHYQIMSPLLKDEAPRVPSCIRVGSTYLDASLSVVFEQHATPRYLSINFNK